MNALETWLGKVRADIVGFVASSVGQAVVPAVEAAGEAALGISSANAALIIKAAGDALRAAEELYSAIAAAKAPAAPAPAAPSAPAQ